MIRNICVILTALAILTTTGIASEGYGEEGEDYVRNGYLTELVYYGSQGYWTMWNSYVHLLPYASR